MTPERMIRADGLVMRFSASIACSARYSWTNPMIPLSATMTRMRAVSLRSPMAAVIAAAPSRTRIIAFVNCSARRRHAGLAARSSSSFGPYAIRRCRASSGSRPRSPSEPSAATTSGTLTAQGSRRRSLAATSSIWTPEGPPTPGNALTLSVRSSYPARSGRPSPVRLPSVNAAASPAEVPIGPIGGIGPPESSARATGSSRSGALRATTAPFDEPSPLVPFYTADAEARGIDVRPAGTAGRAEGLKPLAISQTAMTISCGASGAMKKPSESSNMLPSGATM